LPFRPNGVFLLAGRSFLDRTDEFDVIDPTERRGTQENCFRSSQLPALSVLFLYVCFGERESKRLGSDRIGLVLSGRCLCHVSAHENDKRTL